MISSIWQKEAKFALQTTSMAFTCICEIKQDVSNANDLYHQAHEDKLAQGLQSETLEREPS